MFVERLIKYCIGASSYGFVRCMRSNDENIKNELITDKISLSFMNSLMYANPTTSLIYVHKLVGRIEIKLTNRDPLEYKYYYQEFPGNRFNYDTI